MTDANFNDDLIHDLKQFIAATVSQATAHLATKEDLNTGLHSLRSEMNRRFDDMDQKLTASIRRAAGRPRTPFANSGTAHGIIYG